MIKRTWKYYDYCHNSYTPIISPRGKLSSEVLLENSFLPSVHQKTFLSIIKKIRDAIGPWNTVCGVKLDRSTITWELYFYNNRRMDPRKTVTNIVKILRSYFEIPVFKNAGIETQPYFMFSVDLSDGIFRSKQIDSVHLYMEGRSGVSQGNSYYWGYDGMCFENHYDFYLMPQEAKQFIYKIKQSAILAKDSVSFLKHGLVRQLMLCHKICVAHKKDKDGIYFSRVNIGQLLCFLEYFSYPNHIVDFIRTHQEKLDHLLYDVAFDCTLGPKGFVFGKSSYYSIF